MPNPPSRPLVGPGAVLRGLGGGYAISMLARGFWVEQTRHPDGYGAYAYLLLHRSDPTRLRSIARAYLRMYSKVAPGSGGEPAFDKAVLLAPMRTEPSWPDLEPGATPPDETVEAFVATYDYDAAIRISNHVARSSIVVSNDGNGRCENKGTATPTFAIAASSDPLLPGYRPRELLMRDLGTIQLSELGTWFTRFDQDMYQSPEDAESSIKVWMRNALQLIGCVPKRLTGAIRRLTPPQPERDSY